MKTIDGTTERELEVYDPPADLEVDLELELGRLIPSTGSRM
ncbi:MAG: hypothetical protein ABSF43_16375 [Rectinemataceae bacterium]|jgi:hypothetical protein